MKKIKILLKGTAGLLLIKLSIFISFFIFNACTKEKVISKKEGLNESQKQALNEFSKSIADCSKEVASFVKRNRLFFENGSQNSRSNTLDSLRLVDSLNFLLLPSTRNATKVLLHFDCTEQDIIDSLGSITDSRQIQAAFAILGHYGDSTITPINFAANDVLLELFVNRASAREKWFDCALEALGVNLFGNLREIMEAGGEKAAKQILGKIARRFLGPWGVALMIGEFAWCMARA